MGSPLRLRLQRVCWASFVGALGLLVLGAGAVAWDEIGTCGEFIAASGRYVPCPEAAFHTLGLGIFSLVVGGLLATATGVALLALAQRARRTLSQLLAACAAATSLAGLLVYPAQSFGIRTSVARSGMLLLSIHRTHVAAYVLAAAACVLVCASVALWRRAR
jgi:hypothetical protein